VYSRKSTGPRVVTKVEKCEEVRTGFLICQRT
jgi:hypothetical protein